MMNSLEYHIPQFQPLNPSTFFSKKSDIQAYFPFSGNSHQYYYLARNAIWHGVDYLGLKPGDVVLMPAFHHGIEVDTLLSKGLKLIYYRIDDQMRIDFDHLETLVSPEISALYVIHYIGFPQSVKLLSEFAARHKIKYIEDCALSLFSSSPEGPLGISGDISIYCLYKTLPIPHGGMLVVNGPEITLPPSPENPDWISTATSLSNRLLDSLDTKWGGLGYKLNRVLKSSARIIKRKMPSDHVSINTEELVEEHIRLGISPITRYLINRMDREFIIKRRRENYSRLVELLRGHIQMPFMSLPDGVCPLFLPILVEKKKEAHEKLLKKGVEAVNFWSRNHQDMQADMFPEVTYLRHHVLEVPIHQGIEEKHIEFIASRVKEVT